MMSTAKGKQFQMRVAADASHLRGVRRGLSGYLSERGVKREAADQIVLCVSEALNNAIQHSGTSVPITLEAGLCDGNVTVRVSDEGTGMGDVCIDPARAADPAKSSGRGFFLIWSLMDEFEVSHSCGTIVSMTKRVEFEAAPVRVAACSEGRPVAQRESGDVPGPCSQDEPAAPPGKQRRRRRRAA
jgi:anti-sigma regulatory factor (Ser/Thr protein kinase)